MCPKKAILVRLEISNMRLSRTCKLGLETNLYEHARYRESQRVSFSRQDWTEARVIQRIAVAGYWSNFTHHRRPINMDIGLLLMVLFVIGMSNQIRKRHKDSLAPTNQYRCEVLQVRGIIQCHLVQGCSCSSNLLASLQTFSADQWLPFRWQYQCWSLIVKEMASKFSLFFNSLISLWSPQLSLISAVAQAPGATLEKNNGDVPARIKFVTLSWNKMLET